MPKLWIEKEGPYLYIKKDNGEKRRYNLKTKNLEKQFYGATEWSSVEKDYKFFRGYEIEDVTSEHQKFIKLLELTKEYNPRCKSLSTFFNRMQDMFIYEAYLDEEIEFSVNKTWTYRGETSDYEHLERDLSNYSKDTIKLFKETRYIITRSFERDYFKDKFIQEFISGLVHTNTTNDDRQSMINFTTSYNFDRVKRLVNNHNYNLKALINYIFGYLKPFENLGPTDAFVLLEDYYSMANRIGRKVKKYPKYLKSMHDIITANFKAYDGSYDEEYFARVQNPELEFTYKDFVMVIPKTTKDVISEGTSLNHCVSSYIDKILRKECLIIFLRNKEDPESSLVTVEVQNNKVTQARGSYNRALKEEELEFLNKFCEKKQLILEV